MHFLNPLLYQCSTHRFKWDIKVRMQCINLESKEFLKTQQGRLTLFRSICDEVLEFTGSNGVHPGDIAVTCDDYDSQTLFGVPEVSDLVELINEELLNKYEFNENSKKRVPQATSYPSESILKDHLKSTECDCKFFLGPYRRLKGLTVKVVIFVNGHGASRATLF